MIFTTSVFQVYRLTWLGCDERKSGAKVGKTLGSHGSTDFFTGVGTMKKQIQLARIKD